MKKISGLILFSLIALTVIAQSPNAFKYQAVIRNTRGNPLPEKEVTLKISILQSTTDGTVIYSETHDVTTNRFGMVNLIIGTGEGTDDFSVIDWAGNSYFIRVEMTSGCTINYKEMGTSQLLSVPYALHSKTAENTLNPTGVIEEGNLLTYDGNNWVAEDIILGNTGGGQHVNIMQPYLALNYCIALQGLFPSRNISEPFLGTIAAFGFNFPPRGWATCDGQLLPIAQNSALFALLGTTYGGDGRITFGLPDLRGRVPIHYGQGPGLSSHNLGQKAGTESITIITNQLPAHTHSVTFE